MELGASVDEVWPNEKVPEAGKNEVDAAPSFVATVVDKSKAFSSVLG